MTGGGRPRVEFSRKESWLIARGSGVFDVPWARELFQAAARMAGEEPTEAVLLDLRDMTAQLTMADRYEMGKAAANLFFGPPAALVASPAVVDPNRLGELVARNRGVDGRVFTDRAEAEQWLRERVAARSAKAPLD